MTNNLKYDIIIQLKANVIIYFRERKIMSARFEIVFEGMRENNPDVPILSFRDKKSKKKTPKFSINVRNICSYAHWKAELIFEPESFEKMIGLFEDIIASSECDLVIEKKREKLSIDGDVFNGIQMFVMFFKKITFTNIDFSIPKAQPNSKLFGARITRVVII